MHLRDKLQRLESNVALLEELRYEIASPEILERNLRYE